jgi:1,4-dihydroxy-2-naphthoate octaprenyltransferase
MRLNPPKKVTFWISIFAFVVGAALSVVPVAGLNIIGYIVALLAYLLLVLGLIIKGL